MYNHVVLRRASISLLLLAVTPAAAEKRPAPPPATARNADAWCEAHRGEVLVKDADGIWHRLEDNLPSEDRASQFAEAWRGDLDGDRRVDLVLRHVEGCGTRECMYQAFVSCRDGTYSSVSGATYGDKVKVVRVARPKGWSRIDLRNVGEDGDPAARYSWTRLTFGGDGYR
ncbi:MAG TPA: hypothetical protein VM261_19570 [Kofleriaceae bacterium]|nr:hypothetical protein [Kofleriaceae bacterium]